MAKKRKITASAIMSAFDCGESKNIVLTCGSGENSIEVPVKGHLTLAERSDMVRFIVDMVFIEDDGIVEYHPEFKSFAVDYAIVTYFTDIVMPAEGDQAFEFLEKTNIAFHIADTLPAGYVSSIITDAMDLIKWREEDLHKRSKFDEIFERIYEIIKIIGEKTEGVTMSDLLEFVQKNYPDFKDEFIQIARGTGEE